MTHRKLLVDVWGPEYVEDIQPLRTHIARLRAKIEPDADGAARSQLHRHRARRRLPLRRLSSAAGGVGDAPGVVTKSLWAARAFVMPSVM